GMLMAKNPNLSFAMEASTPFSSLYADATPLGPILELRARDDKDLFTNDSAAQSVEYWRATAAQLQFDPAATDDLMFPRMAYAKAAAEQAALLSSRGYTAEAELALRYANQICPFSPEAVYRLVNILAE